MCEDVDRSIRSRICIYIVHVQSCPLGDYSISDTTITDVMTDTTLGTIKSETSFQIIQVIILFAIIYSFESTLF